MYKISVTENAISKRFTLVDRLSTPFVFSLYLFMVLAALFCVYRYGRNIPLAEDWLLVAPLTGNEPDLLSWIWRQNNEHRIPLPKIVMLGILKLTNGNFKAGMYANVLLLSSLALGVLLFVRKLRGGRTKYVDAFFPILLLHIGNWENMVWSWQLSFVLPTVLMLVFFLILIKKPLLDSPAAATSTALILMTMPLSGGNGLLVVPFLAVWMLYCAVYLWRSKASEKNYKRVSAILFTGALLAIMLCGVYFIGYERATWNPPSPGILASLKTSGKFVVLSVGPAVKYSWKVAALSVVVTLGLIAWCVYLVVKASLTKKETQAQHRAWAILLCFCILMVFTAAIGWGRAGLVPQYGMPDRYVLFASPLLFLCFFAGEFYERGGFIQAILFLTMFLLIPFNTKAGFKWREWYQRGILAVEWDLTHNVSTAELARQNKAFLIHWWEDDKLAAHIEMLQKFENSPFAKRSINNQK